MKDNLKKLYELNALECEAKLKCDTIHMKIKQLQNQGHDSKSPAYKKLCDALGQVEVQMQRIFDRKVEFWKTV